jgi:DNA-binding CsgD family transcriptional regulator
MREPDFVRKKFQPLLDRGLQQALAQRIGKEFPRLGGPRIVDLCAQMILEVIEEQIHPLESVRHGQVMWLAVDKNDPPARHKTMRQTRLKPVVLDLSTPEDVHGILNREATDQRYLRKCERLSRQAYEQGGLLGNCDLSQLLNLSESRIASLLAEQEKKTGKLIPRRATLHDVGSGLTHKRIICWKRYAEGKTTEEIARETYHSHEAVDRYLGQFDRVRNCRRQGLSEKETSFTLNCSDSLVREYLAIDDELQKQKEKNPDD